MKTIVENTNFGEITWKNKALWEILSIYNIWTLIIKSIVNVIFEMSIQQCAIENLRLLNIDYYKTSNLWTKFSGIKNAAMPNSTFDFNYQCLELSKLVCNFFLAQLA